MTEKKVTTNKLGRPRCFDRKKALHQALEVFWQRGYEPASIVELCSAMGLTPPSLYAAFGNKSKLFLEAIAYYEATYWDETWQRLEEEADIYVAVARFFREVAHNLSLTATPCGCVVVLSAINISPDSQEVGDALKALREESRGCFITRLTRAVADGQLPADTDVHALAVGFNTFLDGMSIQSRNGLTQKALEEVGLMAVKLLPVKGD